MSCSTVRCKSGFLIENFDFESCSDFSCTLDLTEHSVGISPSESVLQTLYALPC